MKYFYVIFIVLVLLGCSTVSSDISSEFYNIGNAYFEAGEYDKAIRYYSRALDADNPEVNKMRYNLGIAYSESGLVEKGLDQFFLLLEQDDENLTVLQSIAYSYYLNEEYGNALDFYDKILLLFEYDKIALFNKASILLEFGSSFSEKDVLSDDVLVEPENSTESLGDEIDETDQVVELLDDDILPEDADQVDVEIDSDEQQALKDADLLEAKGLLEKLYLIDSAVDVSIALGRLYKETHQWDNFIIVYEKALEEDSGNIDILNSLADYYEEEELYSRVLEYIDRLLAVDELKNDHLLLFRKGSILVLQINDFEQGFKSLRRAVDSGFVEKEDIRLFLESDGLMEKHVLQDYFRSMDLY